MRQLTWVPDLMEPDEGVIWIQQKKGVDSAVWSEDWMNEGAESVADVSGRGVGRA